MMPFPYLTLTVTFKQLETPVNPYFLGSFVRGNFGIYLKKTVCPFGMRKTCDDCLINRKCFYGEIFEPQKEESVSGKDIPHPFVFSMKEEACVLDEESPEERTEISFDMVLFGPALKNVEFFILVFSEMAKNGIGKTRIKSREMVIEDCNGQLVYSSRGKSILKTAQLQEFRFGEYGVLERVSVSYKSPVRLKREGKWEREPDFETLIRATLRRFIFLQTHYGAAHSLPLSTQEIIDSSKVVKSVSNDLRWVKRFRYSNRKEVRMNLGGIVGTQVFEGPILAVHLDLLRFVSVFHLGKSSSFGHGKIGLDE